jgi:hypothetical protein
MCQGRYQRRTEDNTELCVNLAEVTIDSTKLVHMLSAGLSSPYAFSQLVYTRADEPILERVPKLSTIFGDIRVPMGILRSKWDLRVLHHHY